MGATGRLLRKGTSFGQDVFLNEDGTALREHNANALTHAMVLCVPGTTLHRLLALPENAQVRKQVRIRICRETVKNIALRMEKYLRLASNIEISPFDAVALMEKEFGPGIFSKVRRTSDHGHATRSVSRHPHACTERCFSLFLHVFRFLSRKRGDRVFLSRNCQLNVRVPRAIVVADTTSRCR